jgi:tRNA (adenine22-N1)-methyltransferase
MRLDDRLSKIASLVAPGAALADIGSDHARLPLWLLAEGLISAAIATDIAAGPCRTAASFIETAGQSARITVRRGDGLSPLKPGEADTIVIAGLGGASIVRILQRAPKILAAASSLILQPMTGSRLVRAFLPPESWLIADEELAADGGRIYEIILAKPNHTGENISYSDWQLAAGPCLLRKNHPLLPAHIGNIAKNCEKILLGLGKSLRPPDQNKYQATKTLLAKAKEFLQCP